MHQAYRQWGTADGNDTTPMEVDALMRGKGKNQGKNKGKGKGKEKGKDKSKEKSKGKSKDKPKEGTSDTSKVKCFFCKEKGHTRRIAPSSRPGSLRRRQWVTSRVQTPLRKTDGSSPWIMSMRSCAS